jgi:hypothetical protein
MDKLSCDLKRTEVAPTLNSRREFLRAAAASSGVAILSAEFVPETARASTDKVAELVFPPATKAVTPFKVSTGVHAVAGAGNRRRLVAGRSPPEGSGARCLLARQV